MRCGTFSTFDLSNLVYLAVEFTLKTCHSSQKIKKNEGESASFLPFLFSPSMDSFACVLLKLECNFYNTFILYGLFSGEFVRHIYQLIIYLPKYQTYKKGLPSSLMVRSCRVISDFWIWDFLTVALLTSVCTSNSQLRNSSVKLFRN